MEELYPAGAGERYVKVFVSHADPAGRLAEQSEDTAHALARVYFGMMLILSLFQIQIRKSFVAWKDSVILM